MLSVIRNTLSRWRAIQHTSYSSDDGALIAGSQVRFLCKPESRLLIGGKLVVGYCLPGGVERPSFSETLIYLGEGASLETHGDVFIAPGCALMVGKGARMRFAGGNIIANNTTLLCNIEMSFGLNAQLSWGVNVIDDDAHAFVNGQGRPIRRIRKAMHIGDGVGIQANAFIPAGVRIGNNSVVCSGVTLRRDLPSNCVAYDGPDLVVREGYRSGF